MTLEVGTRLYIAPEIQRLKGRPRQSDHSKADLYSLGVRSRTVLHEGTMLKNFSLRSDCVLRDEFQVLDRLRTHIRA
jgi:serine/threonine protein kinase